LDEVWLHNVLVGGRLGLAADRGQGHPHKGKGKRYPPAAAHDDYQLTTV
jgi:hypothetical protein